MTGSERHVLERAVHAIAERSKDAYSLVVEIQSPDGDLVDFEFREKLLAAAKRLRMELLATKGELERKLQEFLLHCGRCNRRVHWIPGVGAQPGHWGHAEPAPDHEPEIQ